MTARPGAPRARTRLVAAALLALAACRHENPRTPVPPASAAIDVSPAALSTAEAGPPATFEVVLRSRPEAAVEVEVRSEDSGEGLVLAPGYAAPTAIQGITFTPEDWDVPRSVAVLPVDDQVDDGTSRYAVGLRVAYTEDATYAAVPPTSVAVSNADDDTPGIAVSTGSLSTAEGGPPATFRLRLTTRPRWSFPVIVASGDAAEGRVRLAGGGGCGDAQQALWVHLDADGWNVPREIEVCPQEDPFAEPVRSYPITVSTTGAPPEYELVPAAVVTVTSVSDDVAALVISPVGSVPLVTAENGHAAVFGVALATPPLADVVVPVTSGNPLEGLLAAGPYQAESVELTFTAANWSTQQLVSVHGQDDATIGDDVGYALAVGPPLGADAVYPSLAARSVPVVNLDDDVPAVTIDPAGPFTTSETGSAASFTVSVAPPRSAVVVRVTSAEPGEGLVRAGAPEQESVDVSFAPDDWGPKRIEIVGQQDHVLDGDVSYAVTVAVVSGDAGYLALPPRTVTITNTDHLASSVALATYDPALGVPRCAAVEFGCGSGTLLGGRDGIMHPGVSTEANAPNTLLTPGGTPSCADGTYGYIRRSIDELKVYTLDGSPLARGVDVRIEAKVWFYSWDYLDLYFAPDAAASPPAWSFIDTLQISASATNPAVLGTTYRLPARGAQAVVRANWRYGGGFASTCSSGAYDDHDDLAFAVSP